MPLTKKQKQEAIDKISDALKDAKSVAFANFDKVTVAESEAMRKDFRTKDVGYLVIKKTLGKLALGKQKYEGEIPKLDGQVAICFGKDLIEPARGIYEFQKKFDNRLSLAGGVFEGKYMDREAMLVIAQIPPIKTLYAQIVNVINSPIQGFVMALDQIAKSKS
jgi:large subunit ribosomal protein L10